MRKEEFKTEMENTFKLMFPNQSPIEITFSDEYEFTNDMGTHMVTPVHLTQNGTELVQFDLTTMLNNHKILEGKYLNDGAFSCQCAAIINSINDRISKKVWS